MRSSCLQCPRREATAFPVRRDVHGAPWRAASSDWGERVLSDRITATGMRAVDQRPTPVLCVATCQLSAIAGGRAAPASIAAKRRSATSPPRPGSAGDSGVPLARTFLVAARRAVIGPRGRAVGPALVPDADPRHAREGACAAVGPSPRSSATSHRSAPRGRPRSVDCAVATVTAARWRSRPFGRVRRLGRGLLCVISGRERRCRGGAAVAAVGLPWSERCPEDVARFG